MSAPPDRPLRDVIRHTAVYGIGSVSVSILGLVLVPIYTHHLTPAEFGLLALVLALYGFLTGVYDLGMTNAVARFYFEAKGAGDFRLALRRMASTALVFLLVYAGLFSLALWLSGGRISAAVTGTAEGAGLIRILALTLLTDTLALLPLTLIRMQERTRLFVMVTGVRFGATLVLNIVFVVVLGWGVRGILLGSAITSAALLVVLLPEIGRSIGPFFSPSLLMQMLGFGLPFVPVLVSRWLIDYSDRYLLEVLTSLDEVGRYSLAYKVAQVLLLAVSAFSMGWAPLRYRIYERSDAKEIYCRLTSYYAIVAGIMTVGISLVARDVVGLIAPASYAPAATVVAPLALSYALYGLFVLMVTGMGVTTRTKPMAPLAVAAAATNIGLNLLLIPTYGMVAAAYTTVIANVILAAGAWYYSEKVYPIPYDWRLMGRVAVLGFGIVWLSESLRPMTLAGGWVVTVPAGMLFVALLFLVRVVRLADVSSARDWIGDFLSKGRP
ncbi:MAG: lipopolysaccharide biosynthesis protein [Vicinamibacteria bacterium]